MRRPFFLVAIGVTLVASMLSHRHFAAAQDSSSASAEGTAPTNQADAEASASGTATTGSDTSGSAQTGSHTTANDTSTQSGSQSTSQPSAGSSEVNTQSSTSTQTDASINSQPSQDPSASANGSASQQSRTNVGQQPTQQGDTAQNRDSANISVQGNARLDARAQRGNQEFQRGLQFGQATSRGLAINEVEQNSIYYRSGFRRGDVIVSLHGRPIRSQADFMRFVIMNPGQRVPVVVFRNGRQQTIYVEYPQEVVDTQHIYDTRMPQSGGAYLGVMFNAQVRDAAVVLSVNPGSPAEKAGLRQGDVILAMNGQETRSYPEVISIVRSSHPGQEVDIVVRRGQSDTQVFAVLDAQANVRTATRQADVRVEQQSVPSNQTDVQIDVNRQNNDGRLLNRDRNNDGYRDRPLLPRLRN